MITVIPIRFLPGNKWFHIRELCGRDEMSVIGTGTADAVCLLNRLNPDSTGSDHLISNAAALPVPDRHRLLAAVYLNTYGPKVATTVSCHSCGKPFDISFSLDELYGDLLALTTGRPYVPDSFFPFDAPGGIKFRFPTGNDELAILGMDNHKAEGELTRRCVPEETDNVDANVLQKAMERIAPLADSEIEAKCPECSSTLSLHFNLQQFLLLSLMNEKKKLTAEIHLLSRFYGWRLNEILELPRNCRLSFVAMTGT